MDEKVKASATQNLRRDVVPVALVPQEETLQATSP